MSVFCNTLAGSDITRYSWFFCLLFFFFPFKSSLYSFCLIFSLSIYTSTVKFHRCPSSPTNCLHLINYYDYEQLLHTHVCTHTHTHLCSRFFSSHISHQEPICNWGSNSCSADKYVVLFCVEKASRPSLCHLYSFLMSLKIWTKSDFFKTHSWAFSIFSTHFKFVFHRFLHTHTHTHTHICTCVCVYIYIYIYIKVGDHSQGWPKGSLFDSYYTKV